MEKEEERGKTRRMGERGKLEKKEEDAEVEKKEVEEDKEGGIGKRVMAVKRKPVMRFQPKQV